MATINTAPQEVDIVCLPLPLVEQRNDLLSFHTPEPPKESLAGGEVFAFTDKMMYHPSADATVRSKNIIKLPLAPIPSKAKVHPSILNDLSSLNKRRKLIFPELFSLAIKEQQEQNELTFCYSTSTLPDDALRLPELPDIDEEERPEEERGTSTNNKRERPRCFNLQPRKEKSAVQDPPLIIWPVARKYTSLDDLPEIPDADDLTPPQIRGDSATNGFCLTPRLLKFASRSA